MKYSKSNLEKIEQIFKEQEYIVRYEKGNFNSGYCLVEAKKIVVINKFYDVEGRINILLDILSSIAVEEPLFTEKSALLYKQIVKSQESKLKELMEIES